MGEAIDLGRSCWAPLKTKDRISGGSSETNMQREETPKALVLKGNGVGIKREGEIREQLTVESKVGWDCQYPVAGSYQNPTHWGKKMSFHCMLYRSGCGGNIVSRILGLKAWSQAEQYK